MVIKIILALCSMKILLLIQERKVKERKPVHFWVLMDKPTSQRNAKTGLLILDKSYTFSDQLIKFAP
jgi:hypothetical protein